ncbi:hypothetical protein RWV98_05150 [Agathobaculum sp. NTUH-O15-33]|uniref:hypothetical protein n=1 Tax=Agathobaculum sp. NTUH-O15-33 TaxID=3079302 RepID=UPI00295877A0|nr:hypothetical protein [Agathobaculum sp. NTUH-O15-33]WNX85664.1 hypothetical protein RWV98_05150 [Agathobaculum sp. NTUH-O15-33]
MTGAAWRRERLLSESGAAERWLYSEGEERWDVLITKQRGLQRVLLAEGEPARTMTRDGALYYALPYREGAPLRAWCEGRPLEERRALCLALLALTRQNALVWRLFPLFAKGRRLAADAAGGVFAAYDIELRPGPPLTDRDRMAALRAEVQDLLGCALPPCADREALDAAVRCAAEPAPRTKPPPVWPRVAAGALALGVVLALLCAVGALLRWHDGWRGPPVKRIGTETLAAADERGGDAPCADGARRGKTITFI